MSTGQGEGRVVKSTATCQREEESSGNVLSALLSSSPAGRKSGRPGLAAEIRDSGEKSRLYHEISGKTHLHSFKMQMIITSSHGVVMKMQLSRTCKGPVKAPCLGWTPDPFEFASSLSAGSKAFTLILQRYPVLFPHQGGRKCAFCWVNHAVSRA